MSSMKTQFGAASLRGARERNEDAWDIDIECGVFVVSDGIGGGVHGDIASRTACTAVIDAARKLLQQEMPIDIEYLFEEANNAVDQTAHWLHAADEMGATLLVAYLDKQNNRACIAWAGDSVAYILKKRKGLILLTSPHRLNVTSNTLTSNIGCNLNQRAQIIETPIEPGDCLLLCTDGVWEVLEEDLILNMIQDEVNAPWLAELLVRTAVDAAGRYSDNATALVLIIDDEHCSSEGNTSTPTDACTSTDGSITPRYSIIEI